MKRMKIMGLCLVAVFAVTAAFAATSASALPEFGVCVAKAGTGKYKNSNCTEKAGKLVSEKNFEFKKEIPVGKFGLTAEGGHSALSTEEGSTIECTGSSTKGEFKVKESGGKQSPTKEVTKVIAKFTGCTELGKNCQNKGAPLGEITTNELDGPIGYISKATKTVGQELHPIKAKALFVTFECEGVGKIEVGQSKTGKLGDCIIAPFSAASVDVMANESELKYNGTKSGSGQEQLPQAFEGKTTHCNLETKLGEGPWERSLQVGNVTQHTEATVELLA
jgi:hypothetical protein